MQKQNHFPELNPHNLTFLHLILSAKSTGRDALKPLLLKRREREGSYCHILGPLYFGKAPPWDFQLYPTKCGSSLQA